MNPNLKADALFLRRVFLSLVFATTLAGAMVGVTTVQAMNQAGDSCPIFCSN
jgi:hypothetical protein